MFLPNLLKILPKHFTILISDDGSNPHQQELLRALVENTRELHGVGGPLLLPTLFTEKNTGKGGAVYRGWKYSDGFSALSFTDADGAVSAGEIFRAECYFRSQECKADALLASRVKMLGRTIHRSLPRHLSGRIFATLVSELLHIPAYDTQCGFKILKIEVYERIRPYLSTPGFAFDVELLLLLLQSGSVVVEFPVDWEDVAGSKVSLLRDSIRMTVEVLKMHRRVQSLQIA